VTIVLPNIRRLFIPDPGHFIASVDLSGADAQVVAWEAEDEDLKNAFRQGIPIHQKNAEDLFGKADEIPVFVARDGRDVTPRTDTPTATANGDHTPPDGRETGGHNTVYWPGRGYMPKHAEYQNSKQGVHATNYGAAAKTIAGTLGWKVQDAADFKQRWFDLHPNIPNVWHRKVEKELQDSRSASNRFGYRIIFFDRIKGLLPEALAWGPQSTVAINCNRGGLQLRKALPWVELLMQVHDELVFQFPWRYEDQLTKVRDALRVEIPYKDPLVIPWKLAISKSSWGECESQDWE
jgi:DNA polymerase I-like protein with 3'-5' exonuclease and polymerase domains